MLGFALGLSVQLFVCFPGLLGQPALCVQADLCWLFLFKFQTFFITCKTIFILSPSQLWPPHRSSLPLCKKYYTGRFVDVTTWQWQPTYGNYTMLCTFISLTGNFFCLFKDTLQGNCRECGTERKDAEVISLPLKGSLCEFAWEFTTVLSQPYGFMGKTFFHFHKFSKREE